MSSHPAVTETQFDFRFAHQVEGFDEHIRRSIRRYEHLIDDVVNLSRYFIEDGSSVVDLGCSTGSLLQLLVEAHKHDQPRARYVGVELAQGFMKTLKCREEILKENDSSLDLSIVQQDVRAYEFERCSLVISLFTIQFIPIGDRPSLFKRIHRGLREGGALIIAEKTLCENSRVQEMMTFSYYEHKRAHFSADEVLQKERSLRPLLKPSAWRDLEKMLMDDRLMRVD